MTESSLLLNSGYKMPLVGLGTWQDKVLNAAANALTEHNIHIVDSNQEICATIGFMLSHSSGAYANNYWSKPDEVKNAVKYAVEVGYRHIDCASAYENETEVGEGLAEALKEGKVKREELFIVTKLFFMSFHPNDVRSSFMDSLRKLNLDYVDLYLMHSPAGFCKEAGPDGLRAPADIDYVDTWKELEKLNKEGLARSIGVSNFNEYQLNRVLKEGSVPPAVNQVEVHPYLTQNKLVEFCQTKGVAVTGYCPLGARGFPREPDRKLLDDPTLMKVAERLGKTAAQVALRFGIQRNVIVIPKSVTPSRIKQNFQVFDFVLSDSDMKLIYNLNKDCRISDGIIPGFRSLEHKYFPFRENYSE